MNNQNENQMNYQTFDDIENVSIDVTSLLSFSFSNSCECLLFIFSMFFLIFRYHSFDHFWFWNFFFWTFLLKKRLKKFFVLQMSSRKISLSSQSFSIFYQSFHQIKLRFRIATQKEKFRVNKFLLRKKVRMTSNDNTLMLLRRRRRLTSRNQRIKKISIFLLISFFCSLSRKQRRSFESDANFAFDV